MSWCHASVSACWHCLQNRLSGTQHFTLAQATNAAEETLATVSLCISFEEWYEHEGISLTLEGRKGNQGAKNYFTSRMSFLLVLYFKFFLWSKFRFISTQYKYTLEAIKEQTIYLSVKIHIIYLYKQEPERSLGNHLPQICVQNCVSLLHKLRIRSIMISFYNIWESFVADRSL